jgi:hypothetical protein
MFVHTCTVHTTPHVTKSCVEREREREREREGERERERERRREVERERGERSYVAFQMGR